MVKESLFSGVGAIDGANASYALPVDYVPGTVAPFVNGQMVAAQAFVEHPPRNVTLEFAPQPGDSVAFFCEVA